jgi:predicted nucleotidyltransferase
MTDASEHEKLRAIADRARRRADRERAERTRLIETRLAEARGEIERLVADFRAHDPDLRRVVLFGSIARGRVKRPSFDIDLAVDSDRYLELVDVALDSSFDVDLFDLTWCSDYVRDAVERYGVEVYRAGG